MQSNSISPTQQPRSRKRSRRVALTTMAAMSGSVLLAACGSEADVAGQAGKLVGASTKGAEKVALVDNVFACKSQLGLSEEACRKQQDAALAEAKRTAPRFQGLADCEKQWGEGKCVEEKEEEEGQSSSGHHHHRSYFSPFVTGYILGKMNSKTPTPVYSAPGGGYQTANGWRLGYAGQPGKYYSNSRAVERPRSIPKVKPASAMARASGFGAPNRTGGWKLASRSGGSSGSRLGG